ncbi:MAG: TM2 domain-containing protein [Bacteroidales bacterium]|jgi:TM2 domain-containing membrane protein YozV|nr:TM2 domain-containing protein [Bacteroidales bacterium]MBR6278173.1 TM2 domain-containing protein [Bacteroidales bacterium]
MAEELQPNGAPQKELQSKTTMLLVSIFLGVYGIHRLLMGYSNWWLQLITLGGCGIWTILDIIKIVQGQMPMADGRPLKED